MPDHQITYIHPGRLPSNAAHTIQVMRMCEGFKTINAGIRLLARQALGGEQAAANDLFTHYGIQAEFPITLFAGRSYERWPPFFRNLGFSRFAFWALYHPWARQANLIYTRDPHTALLCSALGRAFIFEEHAPPLSALDRQARRYIYRSASLQTIVFISKALHEIVQSMRLLPSGQCNFCIAHDAAVLPATTMSPKDGQPRSNPKTVGYIGSILPGRGIDIILGMANAMPNVRIHVIGGTPHEITRYRELGPDNIDWVGRIAPGEVSKYYAHMDVLVMPYQLDTVTRGGLCSAAWMSPLKLFEYMASGIPIVASDLPVLHEVLQNERNALLVTPSDIGTWTSAVARILSSSELGSRLSDQAMQNVRDIYNWGNRARQILAGVPYQPTPISAIPTRRRL